MTRLRIRTRLVAGTAVVGVIVLAVALIVARVEISQLLHDSAVQLARTDLSSFAVDLQRNPGEPPDTVANGLLIVVKDPSGRVVRDTAPDDVRRALPAVASDSDFTFGDDEGRSYVVVGRLVQTSEGDWSLWAARDVSSSRSAVSGIDLVFVLMGIGLLVVLVLASWFLVRGALRPVEEMRRHAETLAGDELLPVGDNDDELARLASTLNDSVSRVRDAAWRERRMVSDAAHELRTPLAGLAAELELTRRHHDDPQQLDAGLVSAQRSAQRLGELATNLLELSRLDEAEAPPETADASEITAEMLDAIDRARTLVADRRLRIDDDIVVADPGARYEIGTMAISRVADNLLSNATRAVGARGTVVVRVKQDVDVLVIRVEDDGPGVPEDFLPVAFERFSRSDPARQREGSGLGLALVAAIAHAAGGAVRAENLGPGFAVEVRLPKM
ncbi:HAMP domain-containing sensor histidine kinase [Pseudolysinimonas kribbensis]|uniref:histidine kinase n=1 Tax=Pseudolysinimonas kribbensis TaxID=433641 RepID=A0ABQ6K6K1_9MICO|nr:HAMP domain-containing sensor histidine kinase [Pseudolysinimonas kribbensis]GMA95371.1 two-component sensor histidine kinase [Pseudolysinimonas kribbensis]